ncbi:MAG: hypothetical protein JXQ83_13915 [Candidatus Glassbacteria bacterium]|nr:hypothetical protein [Candidatus Glassbacteria bacterium]
MVQARSVCRAVLLCMILIPFLRGESPGATYLKQDKENVTMGNGTMEVRVSVSDGTIRSLVNKEDTVDYCAQVVDMVWPVPDVPVGERICGVMVHDELRNKLFSDLDTPAEVLEIKAWQGDGEVSCTLVKKFEGAEFLLRQRLVMQEDHLRWEAEAVKLSGPDRSVKMVLFTPLPIWGYTGWAPIAEAPFESNPWPPFQISFGQMDGGPVGNTNWRTVIPMAVFYNLSKRNALCLVSPFEIPAIRIRFRSSSSVTEDFHWNSRNYSLKERPCLQVVSEYLGLRDDRPARTGLLITLQPAAWRASLGWVYRRYREYFDPAPGFEKYDGVFVSGYPIMADSLADEDLERIVALRYSRGARWEEQHGHFLRYGLMIPDKSVASWTCESHPRERFTNTRAKIAVHAARNKEHGIGTFVYYNTTEAEWRYASERYTGDIARDENGGTIPAYKGMSHPDDRACWLMNSDPETAFGRDLARQAEEMVREYPGIAGFFWDVYGRSYRFDFAHDDGITMINNKPAYYPMFMYLRMMEKHVGPLLHGSGRYVTCNKPTMIQACKGIDGVMARESTPAELKPSWLIAQSYLGLNRHVMILDGRSWQHPERLFLNCLRYGFQYSEIQTETEGLTDQEVVLRKNKAEKLRRDYGPLIERLRGKKWVFHPRALDLPPMTDGNIFRLEDGSVMVAMVSIWRVLDNIPGTTPDLELTCRLPDASEFRHFKLVQPDLERTVELEPSVRENDALTFKIGEHGLASVILLEH